MKTIAPTTILKSSAKPKKSGKKPKQTLKFYGPIHVLVIDAKGAYCRTIWCAIALGLANVLIGAANMAALLYAVIHGDAHAFICTVAHFFSAEAILSLNYANGWSTPMRLRHRRFAHILLQVCGLCCAAAGTTLICVTRGISTSPHGLAGLVTAGFAFLGLLSGICALFKKKVLKIIHMSIGMPTFIASSVCLILGCLTEGFKSWATLTGVIVVIVCIVFYTVFVVGTVFMKCVSRL